MTFTDGRRHAHDNGVPKSGGLAVSDQQHNSDRGAPAPEIRGSEVLFRLRLTPHRVTEYVSPVVEHVLGYSAAEFKSDPGFLREIVVPEDRPLFDTIRFTSSRPSARSISGCDTAKGRPSASR